MAQQTIGIGAVANDGTGDDLRTAGDKINDNFTELYGGGGGITALTGDVTASGTGSVAATIANGSVTLTKQANMATASVVYRKTAGAGAPEVQTLATLKTDLGLTGTNSGDQTSVTGNAGTATALATGRTIAMTGDVTWTSPSFDGTGNVTAAGTIANNAVSFAKFIAAASAGVVWAAAAGNYGHNASGGGTTNFLRADGTWAAPSGAGTVTTTGSPASGNLTKFSGASSIVNGDLSGDVTTTGTLATTIVNANYSATLTATGTPVATSIGYLGSPINTQNGTYGIVMADAGCTIYHTSGSAHTWTLPANGTIALPIGTVIAFVNENGGGVVTLAITSDTLRWGSSTGSRSLAANGTATAIKVASTTWRLTGDGIT